MKNYVNLIGRLGSDPELKSTENSSYAKTSLATSEKYKDKAGEKKEVTEWHNLVFWGKSAEIAEKYLKKGSLIDVTGRIKTRSWEKDGQKNYITEIHVDNFLMLGTKQESSSNSAPAPQQTPSQEPNIGDDDLPF